MNMTGNMANMLSVGSSGTVFQELKLSELLQEEIYKLKDALEVAE